MNDLVYFFIMYVVLCGAWLAIIVEHRKTRDDRLIVSGVAFPFLWVAISFGVIG